jgi:hypothetical protein
MFWLFMNCGKWFSSPRKTALTLLNMTIIGIGAALVRVFRISITDRLLTRHSSVVSAFGFPERPSTTIPAVRVSRVRIMPNSKLQTIIHVHSFWVIGVLIFWIVTACISLASIGVCPPHYVVTRPARSLSVSARSFIIPALSYESRFHILDFTRVSLILLAYRWTYSSVTISRL